MRPAHGHRLALWPLALLLTACTSGTHTPPSSPATSTPQPTTTPSATPTAPVTSSAKVDTVSVVAPRSAAAGSSYWVTATATGTPNQTAIVCLYQATGHAWIKLGCAGGDEVDGSPTQTHGDTWTLQVLVTAASGHQHFQGRLTQGDHQLAASPTVTTTT